MIGLNPELTYYFALFLVEDASGRNIVRRLQDFESPHISLTRADEGNVIQVRSTCLLTTPHPPCISLFPSCRLTRSLVLSLPPPLSSPFPLSP